MRAWWFRANGDRRGTVIYLHGIADNRGSSVRIAEHFVPMGFDVVAYDSRAHGQSTGSACSYGVHEKRDLMRVMDQVDHVAQGPIVVLGTSLGAAVALQAAAADERIAAVGSVATFSDLRTVVAERAPFFASRNNVAQAFAIAERDAAFNVDEASPVAAAPNIRAPVLVIHGARDSETPPEHSRRVFAALKSEKRLVVVPDAGHNDCLKPAVWREIDAWLVAALAKGRAPS